MGSKKKSRGNVQKKKKADYRDPNPAKRKFKSGGGGEKKVGGEGRFQGRSKVVAPFPANMNPFEMRVNRVKHETLGRRLAKNEKGLPGLSRARANEKRKSTLLEEYKMRNKTNLFKDNRFGQKNPHLSEEDKMLKRTAIERTNQYKKKSIFNLPEEEFVLTHKGQPLSTNDRYEDDPRDSDSDSDAERLDEKFVGEMNFSGFLKKKSRTEAEEAIEEKSREERISELILESKKRKHEKMQDKDENYSLVQSLDEQFKSQEFRNVLTALQKPTKAAEKEKELKEILEKTTTSTTEASKSKSPKSKSSSSSLLEKSLESSSEVEVEEPVVVVVPAKSKPKSKKSDEVTSPSDYDKLVHELLYEKKGGLASSRTKTEEELEKEELERLEKMELDRLRRMKKGDGKSAGFKHKSVDDLDDEFYLEDNDDNQEESDDNLGDIENDSEDENESTDQEEEEENEGKSEEEDEDNFSDLDSLKDLDLDNLDDDNDQEDNDKDGDDSISGPEFDEIMTTPERIDFENEKNIAKSPSTPPFLTPQSQISDSIIKKKSKSKESLSLSDKNLKSTTKSTTSASVGESIPFTIAIPDDLSNFKLLLNLNDVAFTTGHNFDKDFNKLQLFLDRIFSYNKVANKSKVSLLFNYLLELGIGSCWKDAKINLVQSIGIIDQVAIYLHEIAQLYPIETSQYFITKLTGFQKMFTKSRKMTLQMVLFIRISSGLYPSTDFRHLIQSPTNLFLLQLVNQSKINSIEMAIYNLLLCEIVYKITSESKRFCSEPISYISSILLCFCNKKSKLANLLVSPKIRPVMEFLQIVGDISSTKVAKIPQNLKSLLEMDSNSVDSNEFKIGFLLINLKLLSQFCELHQNQLSAREIFLPLEKVFVELENVVRWPKLILDEVDQIRSTIAGTKDREIEHLKVNIERPKVLKLYEPLIEEGFDGVRRKNGPNRQKKDEARLSHKVKQEFKSAVREIKKDSIFLAKHQLKEQIQRDNERKRKVNEIMGMLANQEGDYKKMKRGK